ncbi:hypothetical protein [Mucilaginibacter sp.]|uniref:hypothetical protein n=1 Tax=Mucilaginibacter sp. TaxID=1882438 RepID=UPI00283B4F7A|nr:hypothetical protein [Mucilaginibacter sp.]MDR3693940.1 hypothetical protein [Mucilaginibacter sp.]
MESKNKRVFLYLTIPLAVLVVISAVCGIFIKSTYVAETQNWRIQGIGQDMVDLFIAMPVLITSGILAYRGNRAAFFVWGGTLLFLLYSYAIYCFAVHFNSLFLVYCFTFGLSVYSFTWLTLHLPAKKVKEWFDFKGQVKWFSGFLVSIALIFYFLWLTDIVPAIVSGKMPLSYAGTGMLTNPVHVIDISILLPGMVITAVFLLKKAPAGYLLTPILTVFFILMACNIAWLVIFMKQKGIGDCLVVAKIMGIFAAIGSGVLYTFLRRLKKTSKKIHTPVAPLKKIRLL